MWAPVAGLYSPGRAMGKTRHQTTTRPGPQRSCPNTIHLTGTYDRDLGGI